jgi:autotransporter-associated beta strand protein
MSQAARLFAIALLAIVFPAGAAGQNTVVITDGNASDPGSLGSLLYHVANDGNSVDSIGFSSTIFSTPQTINESPYSSYTAVSKSSLSVAAPSQVTITAGTYTPFTFSNGTLNLTNLAISGTGVGLSITNGTVNLNTFSLSDGVALNNSTLQTSTALTTAASITLTNGGGLSVGAGLTSTFSGTISGIGGLSATGSGTTVLSNSASTYTGGTGISGGGVLSIAADGALGNTSGTNGIGFNNGTLVTTTGITSARAVSIGSGGAIINVSSGQTSTLNGQIAGVGALSANGSGTLALGYATNVYASTTVSGGGTLSVASGGSLGTGSLTLNASTLRGTGNVSVFGGVAISGGATVNAVNSGQTTTLTTVTGSGGLNIIGSGTVALSGSNTYSGGTNVSGGGTVAADRDYELGATSGTVTLNNGTLSATDGLATSRAIALGSSGGTVTATSNGSGASLSGTISGSGALAVSGPVALNGTANTYMGGTTVTSGALAVAGDGSLGATSGSVTLNGGELEGENSFSTARTLTLGSSGGAVVAPSADTITLAGKVTGTGSLTLGATGITNATVVLSGTTNDYSGGTSVAFGTTLLLKNGTATGAGNATGRGTLNVNSGATLAGSGSTDSKSFAIQGAVVVGTGTDTTSGMNLVGDTASTFTGANLTFNLGAGVYAGQNNVLALGSTAVTFTNTSLTLDIIGTGYIVPQSTFTLITFSSPIDPTADGLTVGSNGQITSGLSIAPNSNFGVSTNGYTGGTYGASYLYVSGDSIDVRIVPEPPSSALLLAGLGGLAWLLRGRRAWPRMW